jgi:hypothetical protein
MRSEPALAPGSIPPPYPGNAATAYLPSLTQNLPRKPAGYQFIAKKYMKKGVFYAFGIGVAE